MAQYNYRHFVGGLETISGREANGREGKGKKWRNERTGRKKKKRQNMKASIPLHLFPTSSPDDKDMRRETISFYTLECYEAFQNLFIYYKLCKITIILLLLYLHISCCFVVYSTVAMRNNIVDRYAMQSAFSHFSIFSVIVNIVVLLRCSMELASCSTL